MGFVKILIVLGGEDLRVDALNPVLALTDIHVVIRPGTPDDVARSLEESPGTVRVAAAAGMRVTLNTLLLGAWAALLGRHASADDVTFGVTVSERPPEIDEQLTGLREQAGAQPSFATSQNTGTVVSASPETFENLVATDTAAGRQSHAAGL